MLCDVCRGGLEGIWDKNNAKRIGLLKDFPDILGIQFQDVDDGDFDRVLNKLQLQEPERYVFGHHADYGSLLRSKQQSCVVCNEFGEVNDHDDVNEVFASLGYYSVFCVNLTRPEFHQPMMVVYSGDPIEEFPHGLVAHDESDSLNSTLSSSTSHSQTWELVEKWLNRCLESHEGCLRQYSEHFTPTRLLEARTLGAEQTFRLIQHGEFDPRERYVTLSHCWGPEPAWKKLRLLESTRGILQSGLPITILPKTFRHAFEIIARLNIRYLWIDRLCIVQDSAEDWQAEAATMHSVYRHGFLNIAALGAYDDQVGCFFDRDPTLVAPTIVNLQPRIGGVASFYRFEGERESWRSTFKGEPLLSRAWVLQERLLATRNLYFGSKQVFWECCGTNCCETVPNHPLVPVDNSKEFKKYTWKSLIDAQRTTGTSTDWSDVVEAYCQCNLTFSSDKLVALSGLAKRMGDRLSHLGPGCDTYLAGLWKHTMPRSLLWQPKTQGHRVPAYRAPSWSWASLDGEISFIFGGGVRWHVSLIDASTVPRGMDVTAELTGGVLHLDGPVCTARDMKKRVKTLESERESYIIKSLCHPKSGFPIDANFRSAYLRFDSPSDEYDTVALLLFNSNPHKPFSFVTIRALALVLSDSSQSSYRRVGYAFLEATVDFEDFNYERKLISQFPSEVLEIV
ncbi:HET-domain-containing protein [Whalleya microplaca]|nr:HET-domain-containing protein [Whalleya microplaca]